MYAQQVTLHEKNALSNKSVNQKPFCPRTNAIKCLNELIPNELILNLQSNNHAIVLMLDANQMLTRCFHKNSVKPYSIEWLRLERGMDDPFIQTMMTRPNSTTHYPNRDIDYVLTHGVPISSMSTVVPNYPAHSDHLGTVFDINLYLFFSSTLSDLHLASPRFLTSGNEKSVSTYIKYMTEQFKNHEILERVQFLLDLSEANHMLPLC